MKTSVWVTGFAVLLAFPAYSQALLDQGTVRYEMTGMTTEPGGGPSIFTVFFSPERVLTKLQLPTGEEALSVLYDYSEQSAYMIFRDKKQALVTPVGLEEMAVTGADHDDFTVEMPQTAPRNLLGYNCREVLIKYREDAGSSPAVHAWVTDSIASKFRIANGLETLLGGYPLQIEFSLGNGAEKDRVAYKAVEISGELPADVFVLPK